jgi:hypothetical protein
VKTIENTHLHTTFEKERFNLTCEQEKYIIFEKTFRQRHLAKRTFGTETTATKFFVNRLSKQIDP